MQFFYRLFYRKPKEIPVYCPRCGEKLIVHHYGRDFDRYTGKPAWYKVAAFCPAPAYMGRTHWVQKWHEPVSAEDLNTEK